MLLTKNIYRQSFVIALVFVSFAFLSCAESPPGTSTGASTKFDQTKYDEAEAFRGGRLYDNWWELKFDTSAPTRSNPIWEEITKQISTNPNGNNGGQWRCVQCHGWDYKGNDGAYKDSSNSNYTNVRGLNNGNILFDPEHIFKMIVNGIVDYGSKTDIPHQFVASDALELKDAYDLAKFVFDKARSDQISPIFGTRAQGEVIFNNIPNGSPSSCNSAGCHTKVVGPSNVAPSLDTIIATAKNDPQRFLHKVRFGTPKGGMPDGMSNENAQNVFAFVLAGAGTDTGTGNGNGPTPTPVNFSQTLYDNLSTSNIIVGGKLYDQWWDVAANTSEPSVAHTRWPASNTVISAADTWRCKECHGWDYRGADGAYGSGIHATGYQGIVSTDGFAMQYTDAEAVYTFLKEDTKHGFDGLFSGSGTEPDLEYYALTKFIMTIRAEVLAKKSAVDYIEDRNSLTNDKADTSNGKTLYSTSCDGFSCHGSDGKNIDFKGGDANVLPNQFVHNIAQENPWRFIHKIRFGQPRSPAMPTLFNRAAPLNSIDSAADILAHSQNTLVPNIKRAGLLYDEWWNVKGVDINTPPSIRNETWIANAGSTDETKVSNESTWRCSQCHGWDYQGVRGAYGDNTNKNYSGIRGFITPLNTVNKDKAYIASIIKDGIATGKDAQIPDHDYGQFLSDQDINLLADFILDESNGVLKIANTYAAYITDGKAQNGKVTFEDISPGNCITCHGAKGTSIASVDLAAFAKSQPEEFFHKVRYGNPGTIMQPSSNGFSGLKLQNASNVLAYAKTLTPDPTDPGTNPGTDPGPDPGNGNTFNYAAADVIRGGRLYDQWWTEMQISDDTVQVPTSVNPYWTHSNRDPKLDFPTTWTANEKIESSWRCQNCHAWDYKGIGFFAGRTSDNLLQKIALRRDATFQNDETALQNYIYDWLKTGKGGWDPEDPSKTPIHNFGESAAMPTPLGERELWDLTKFLLEDGLIDSDSNILTSGIAIGTDTTIGGGLYDGSIDSAVNCNNCHGASGDTPPPIPKGGSGNALDIFLLSSPSGNPWSFLHKIRFGQPGTSMPALYGTSVLTNKDAFDVLGYAQQEYSGR